MPLKEYQDRPIKIRQGGDFTPENLERIQEHFDEMIRNLFGQKLQLDVNGDLIVPGDIRAEDGSLYISADSLYLGGIKLSAPSIADDEKAIVFNKDSNELNYETQITEDDVDTAVAAAIAGNIHNGSHLVGGGDSINHNNLANAYPSVRNVSSTWTAIFYEITTCTGTFTVTLPSLTASDIGEGLIVMNIGTGVITLDGYSTNTIMGETDALIFPGDTFNLVVTSVTEWRLK